MRHQERGMSMWPFVITLVLLLGFIFLWYDQKGEADKLTKRVDDLTKEQAAATQQLSETETYLDEVTKRVGFATKQLPGHSRVWTNVDELDNVLNPDKDGSPVADLKKAAVVPTKRDLYRPKAGAGQPTTADLAKLPQGFKEKVAEVRAAYPGVLPAAPDDPDDAAGMARYKSDLEAYQAQFAKYRSLLDELVKMKEFAEYKAVLGAGTLYDPDKTDVVNWTFWERPPTANVTVEDYLKVPPQIVKYMRDSLVERVNALLTDVAGLQKSLGERDKVIDNGDAAALGLKQQLEAVQAQLAADTAKLQKEAQDARAALEQQRVSQTTAEQALAKEKEDRKVDVAKLEQEVKARDNRIREDKERKDLAIQRDDPDGIVLAADNNLGIAYVNLGTADKVYAGLPFRVSYIGRGGIRSPKGDLIISKVLDVHYSQARIVSLVDGEKPMGAGDLIANPFFDAKRTIHLYLPGDLKKYPKTIALDRLKRMGVVVDESINEKTDFVLIPEGVTATPAAPAEGGAAPAAGAESEYDRLVRLARAFGATLVTERMLESFLDY